MIYTINITNVSYFRSRSMYSFSASS